MFKKISNYFNKKNLKDKKYSFLFDKHLENEYVCFDCETTGLDPKNDDNISYRDWETDRKSTRLNSSHRSLSRMPSSA